MAPFKNLTASDLALWLWGTRREGGQDWLLTEAKIAATFGEVDDGTLDAALVLVGKVRRRDQPTSGGAADEGA
ncbi:MAG TPA: hypothetical protein VM574_03850 [Terrimicrobiaceae bacterium]|nr:hypothetical protein [Terrimicrobiaceae bacterium]